MSPEFAEEIPPSWIKMQQDYKAGKYTPPERLSGEAKIDITRNTSPIYGPLPLSPESIERLSFFICSVTQALIDYSNHLKSKLAQKLQRP